MRKTVERSLPATMRTRCVYAILIKILMVFSDSHAELRKFGWWRNSLEISEICGIIYGDLNTPKIVAKELPP